MMRNGNKVHDSNKIVIVVITICVIILLAIIGIYYLVSNSNNDNSKNEIQNEIGNSIENAIENEITSNEPTEEEFNDVFGKYYNKALEKIKSMTLEEKVGQMFLARCPEIDQINEIKNLNPGGYILFGRDFKNKTKAQVVTNIQGYQNSSKIPMLIGIDEEGGTVVRASLYKEFRSKPFASPQEIFKQGGMNGIKADVIEKSDFLLNLGINVNLAPVCDVSTNPDDFIFERSFGKDAKATSEFVSLVVKTMKEKNIGQTLKHFPGYGNNVDTHTGIAIDKRKMETFETSDFLPFKAGINNGADSILVSHNVVECMDNSKPASISKNVHDILLNKLGFTGIIMTDDMAMDGIKEYASKEEAAVLAVKAGNDMIISSDLEVQSKAVIDAVNTGDISIDIINNAVKKVIAWKYSLGIIK